MSRSKRRPYSAATGHSSAKADKRLAHRGVRRAQLQSLKTCADFESFLLPHPIRCTWNDNWVWVRDGKQSDYSSLRFSSDPKDLRFYRKLMRK